LSPGLVMMLNEGRRAVRVADTTRAIFDAAVSYAARGWWVVPLAGGGRAPLVDLEQIVVGPAPDERLFAHWWQLWPYAALGIATGQSSRLIVVSVPRDMDRQRRAIALGRAFGVTRPSRWLPRTLPETAVVAHAQRTHHYFTASNVSISTCDVDGTRIFGEAGVVLAPPPSIHAALPRWEHPLPTGDMPATPEWVPQIAAARPGMRSRFVV
jgi:hypothetical protein